jgi:hypothetical protein
MLLDRTSTAHQSSRCVCVVRGGVESHPQGTLVQPPRVDLIPCTLWLGLGLGSGLAQTRHVDLTPFTALYDRSFVRANDFCLLCGLVTLVSGGKASPVASLCCVDSVHSFSIWTACTAEKVRQGTLARRDVGAHAVRFSTENVSLEDAPLTFCRHKLRRNTEGRP